MPADHPKSSKVSDQYDVEILTTEDVWSKFGAHRLAPAPASSSQTAGIHWQRVGMSSVGVLCTLALHGLLMGTLLFGTAGRPQAKPTPLIEGASASGLNNAAESVSVLIFLNDRSISPPEWSPDETAYSLAQTIEQQNKDALIASLQEMQVSQLTGSESGTDEASPTAEATGDGAGRAMLFGRYMGQIQARVERAWVYPLPEPADRFECRAQIKQNRRGDVLEVTLQRCGKDPRWQLSLVQAIQQASPLSGPPDESVFTEIVTLHFSAEPTAKIVDTSLPVEVAGARATSTATTQ